MDSPTRRNFLKDLGFGAAAVSVPGAQAKQMPGRPSSGATPEGASAAAIMAIAAHPGDAFFAMGAPVALQAHLGGQGVFLSLTLGEKGSAVIPPERYGILQRQASERAAEMFRAKTAFLTYPDGEIPVNDEVKFAVCDLIRKYKPDLVITHWRGSWHKDHRACYEIVNDAIFYAALPAIVRSQPAHNVRKLFFNDNWEDASGFEGDTYLDISPVFAAWQSACAVFPMWRGENGFRYNDYYHSLAVARGCVAGFTSAVALMSPPEQLTGRVHAL
ncbi:MAG: PIG-L deacetylase family protein [Terriglobia bacterium]